MMAVGFLQDGLKRRWVTAPGADQVRHGGEVVDITPTRPQTAAGRLRGPGSPLGFRKIAMTVASSASRFRID
jgi:hypothetical protein